MFLVYCAECEERMLLPVRHVQGLHNLAGGVIAVELTCYEGHRVIVLTGSGIDIPGPATV
ncbi:hypothetical protein [Thermoactinospora rubra]|uniref:hypothetical protein n=1 Tax=Thermoactinospora rubra TaxID=1088767 RepID=UPI000A0F9763|nr:hypothetical protein [Thermoactinospora rubra]